MEDSSREKARGAAIYGTKDLVDELARRYSLEVSRDKILSYAAQGFIGTRRSGRWYFFERDVAVVAAMHEAPFGAADELPQEVHELSSFAAARPYTTSDTQRELSHMLCREIKKQTIKAWVRARADIASPSPHMLSGTAMRFSHSDVFRLLTLVGKLPHGYDETRDISSSHMLSVIARDPFIPQEVSAADLHHIATHYALEPHFAGEELFVNDAQFRAILLILRTTGGADPSPFTVGEAASLFSADPRARSSPVSHQGIVSIVRARGLGTQHKSGVRSLSTEELSIIEAELFHAAD